MSEKGNLSNPPSPLNPSPTRGEGDQGRKLLIVDGNAIVHRAFHAYPPTFSDAAGNPTNAIYGFYAMLIKVMEEIQPTHLVICFDKGAPTFRMTMYAGYHENRPKMQDGLASQLPRLQASLEHIGIPLFGVEGYEADDLIGTLARQATEGSQLLVHSSQHSTVNDEQTNHELLETVILTGDRDLLQLVNSHVKVLMPITGITKSVLMDEKAVEEKYGVTSSQFIDYKALVGDQSDGYPGVTGIGPKGAAALLKEFKTLENIYTHLGDVKPEVGQKLATDAEQCMLAKKLATIQTDAPVHLDMEKANVENFTTEKFLEVFEEFNIHSLVRRLLGEEPKGPNGPKEPKGEKILKHPPASDLQCRAGVQNDKKRNEDQLELL